MSAKTVFIHGRPGPHPFHAILAEAIGAEFLPVDFLLRWHDVPSRRFRKYLSWLLCALFFPRLRTYHTLLLDSVHFLPLLMRRLGRLRKGQRVVAFLHDETLFFLKEKRYSSLTHRALLSALRTHDALICFGEMQAHLARSLLGERGRPVMFTIRGGAVGRDRLTAFNRVRPALDGRVVLFIGFGPAEWRGWYKGLDLLLHAVGLVSTKITELNVCVVGEWDPSYIEALQARLPVFPSRVEFAGSIWDLSRLSHCLSGAALYVHLGRGDAFGISVLEAMCAGLPPIVSEWTGAREVVEKVDPRLVVPCDAKGAAERIQWYFQLSLEEKKELSARSREIAIQYTEEHAVESFVEAYCQILRHFSLPELSQETLVRNRMVDGSRWWPKQG